MSSYMLHDECQALGKHQGFAPLSPLNIYMGLCSQRIQHAWAWHQCTSANMERGKGL